MKKQILPSIVVLAFGGVLLCLAFISFPVNQTSTSGYPPPMLTQSAPLDDLSPESLCDQWFSYRKAQPEDQRNLIEQDYINCIAARRTPSPVASKKYIPAAIPDGNYSSPFLKRAVGIGTVVETNFSPLSSQYKIINQWFADADHSHVSVYAGGFQDTAARVDTTLDLYSWSSVLVVVTTDENGKTIPENGGVFWAPQNAGPIRIVDGIGNILTLVANNGNSFRFDVMEKKYLSPSDEPIIKRSFEAGEIIESGNDQVHKDEFKFVNQWKSKEGEKNAISLFAGYKQSNPQQGVLFILSYHDTQSIEEMAFQTNLDDGALRIINVEGKKITLVSESGLIYEFDLAKLQMTSIPPGSTITEIPLNTAISSPGMGYSSATITPANNLTPQTTGTGPALH